MTQLPFPSPKLKLIDSSKHEILDFKEARIEEFLASRQLSNNTKNTYRIAFRQFIV